MIKIAVDLLGADRSETQLLGGVIDAINENPDLFVYILGTKEVLEAELAKNGVATDRFEVIDATEVITSCASY